METNSIDRKFTFVVEYIAREPSKYSYNTTEDCAQKGLAYAKEKFGDKLINVYVMCGDKLVDSWKK